MIYTHSAEMLLDVKGINMANRLDVRGDDRLLSGERPARKVRRKTRKRQYAAN